LEKNTNKKAAHNSGACCTTPQSYGKKISLANNNRNKEKKYFEALLF
jgi:hypothetical protein